MLKNTKNHKKLNFFFPIFNWQKRYLRKLKVINIMSGFTNPTATSTYIVFCHAKRDEVKAANPTALIGDTGCLLRALWNQMSDSEKAAYSTPRVRIDSSRNNTSVQKSEPALRRSSRLRNKRAGVNFFGVKL